MSPKSFMDLAPGKNLLLYEQRKGRTVMRIFKERLGLSVAGKKILEVGCSTGALMELLERDGADAWGIDVESPWSKEYAHKTERRLFCDLQEEISPALARFAPFDMIVAQEVIEHIKKPYDFLERARSLLKEDGTIFLTTPNLIGITALLKREKWCGITTEGHALLYSPRSLDFLLCNAGFKKIKLFTNVVPIVYQDRYRWSRRINRLLMASPFGGGLMAYYKKYAP